MSKYSVQCSSYYMIQEVNKHFFLKVSYSELRSNQLNSGQRMRVRAKEEGQFFFLFP